MLQFRIQSTPNPLARKYIISQDLKAEGKVSYQTLEDCQHVPMARDLISIPGVRQIHFFENVLTVTQDGTMDWPRIDDAVQDIIALHIQDHDVNFSETNDDRHLHRREKMSPELLRIDEILDHTIRPALQADGGDVDVLEYEGGILTVSYLGACGDCPSSMMGTLEAIKSVLRDQVRPDIEVVVL